MKHPVFHLYGGLLTLDEYIATIVVIDPLLLQRPNLLLDGTNLEALSTQPQSNHFYRRNARLQSCNEILIGVHAGHIHNHSAPSIPV